MKKHKIFVDGQEGTTGLEIHKRLSLYDELEILRIQDDKRKNPEARKEYINSSDITFLCLPDDAARESVSMVRNPDVRVIDASTAHRTDPLWAYGIPELSSEHRNRIKTSRFVSVPGCHATAFIVPVFPLLENEIIPRDYHFTFTSLTGYSGGGKARITEYESNIIKEKEYPRHYALELKHKHLPEIMNHLRLVHEPVFAPVLCNVYRGMQVSIPFFPDLLPGKHDAGRIFNFLNEYYKDEQFIRVHRYESGEFPMHRNNNTNYLDILVAGRNNQILIISCIDNLGKGAAGAAVQNMNIMLGFDENYNLI